MLKKPPIYISYAWGCNSNPEEEKVVNALYSALTSHNYEVVRDIDYLKYLDNLPDFFKTIGKGGYVVSIVGNKYLHSENCMIEASYMAQKGDLKLRVFPVLLSTLKSVFNIETRNNLITDLEQFWKPKEEELKKTLAEKNYPQGFISMRKDASSVTKLIDYLSEFVHYLGTTLEISSQEHIDEKFKRLIESGVNQRF